MPLQNREVTCDICPEMESEVTFNAGWPGWAHIQGIGAQAPEEGTPISNENLEMWLCPDCKTELAIVLDKMQQYPKAHAEDLLK